MRFYEHGGDIYGDGDILLDFSVNINPMGMPDRVKRAIAEHIPAYESYPDPLCRALRAALAERHGVDAPMILCGNGAAELIFALCAYLKPLRMLTLAPTFSEYGRAAALYGASVREHSLEEAEGFALTARMLDDLTPETDLLVLCNPNNPTGRLCGATLLHKIAEACRRNGTLLLVDECFIEFTGAEGMLPHLRDYPNLLVLRAFTKIYAMAGLRLGMLYGVDEGMLSRIAEFCPPWNVSGVAQAAGIAALTERDWIPRTQQLVEGERAFMTAALLRLGVCVYPGEGNFLLLRTDPSIHGALRERGILTRSCANFTGLDGRYLRIGLKTREENEALLGALEEILNG